MYLPGYYRTNYRALRFRELIRMFGWFRLPFTYFKTRIMPPSNPVWMPGLWAENECEKEDLSGRFWQITDTYQQEFRRLGFKEVGFSKLTCHLNPTYPDNGGIRYLDESCCYFALLLYTRVNADCELITVALTVAFERGTLSYTNSKNAFDPLPHQKVVRLSSASPEPMYQRLREATGRRAERPRHFPDLESLKKWFDEMQDAAFQERAQRRLFLRMSDGEAEAARLNNQQL
jgi:hypothetical protein